MHDPRHPQDPTQPEGETPVERAMIICPSCERVLPSTSQYCPYCCGEDGRRGALTRGAFLGAVFGLLGGGLATAVWASIIGPEHAPWGPAMTITLAGGVIGVLAGVWTNRKG